MKSESGFSLTELMVTVTILAVLLMLALPSFNDSIARRRLEGVANELSANLQTTRGLSIASNSSISFVATSTGYTIAALKTVTIDSRCQLAGVSPSVLPVTITFEAHRGTAVSTGAVEVSCVNTKPRLEVSVNDVGQVRICSPDAGFPGYPAC